MQEIEGFFRHHLAVAAARGEIAADADQSRLADALVGAVVAIMTLARAGAAARMVGHVAEQAIVALGPGSAAAPA
jgi:hypothetical protein